MPVASYRNFASVVFAVTLVVSAPGMAGNSCPTDARLVGPCYTVRGRLTLSNGTPSVRIWVVGTKRILGVSEGRFSPDGYEALPRPVPEELSWDKFYFGDYTVCPFTPQQVGVMQLVCVAGVNRLKAVAR
jgi:hypothetical protein